MCGFFSVLFLVIDVVNVLVDIVSDNIFRVIMFNFCVL